MLLPMIAIVGGVVAYLVFTIVFLVEVNLAVLLFWISQDEAFLETVALLIGPKCMRWGISCVDIRGYDHDP